MARGWESKAVEAQQDEARRGPSRTSGLSEADRATAERRRTLELARAKAMTDLARATAPAHKTLLTLTIAALDQQLAGL